jgi:hypothetical protein
MFYIRKSPFTEGINLSQAQAKIISAADLVVEQVDATLNQSHAKADNAASKVGEKTSENSVLKFKSDSTAAQTPLPTVNSGRVRPKDVRKSKFSK